MKFPHLTFSVDDDSNVEGSSAWIMLEGPDNLLIEKSLKFGFKVRNNQFEYKAFITDTVLTLKSVGIQV